MDFLRNHTRRVGGDTRRARNIRDLAKVQITPFNGGQGFPLRQLHAFSISRQTYGRQDPPTRQTLKIYQITLNPFNPLQPKYPMEPHVPPMAPSFRVRGRR
jgi:hypothetical protein